QEALQPLIDVGVELEVVRLALVFDAPVEAEAVAARLAVEPGTTEQAVLAEQTAAKTEALEPELEVDVQRGLGAGDLQLGHDLDRTHRRRRAVVIGPRGRRQRHDQPAHDQDRGQSHRCPPSRRRRISAGVSPATRTSLSRPCAPCSMVTAPPRTPSTSASSAATAALAAPSTGGAATRTPSAPSARQPTISLR